MGYSYTRTSSGRSALSCDGCGGTDGTRKRVCIYTVTSASQRQGGPRHTLPYCKAPALCSACLKDEGGIRGVHGDRCRDGAAASQAADDAEQALIDSGAYLRRSACTTPDGMVEVLFRGPGDDLVLLMSKSVYRAIPLLTPATPDDYRAIGEVIDPSTSEAA